MCNKETYLELIKQAEAALARYDWNMFDTLTEDMEVVWEQLSEAEKEYINNYYNVPEEDEEAFTDNPTL